jgi:oxalate decarboxylase
MSAETKSNESASHASSGQNNHEGELPAYTYALEEAEAKTIGKNTAREATVVELPISVGLAGVSMRLEPGGMRELHWHATAAEWGFVVEGNCRTTLVDPQGRSETNDFGPGDVWYFPKGHPHSIQGLGPGICHFILIFDNGYFSEFGTFSITDWLGHTPKSILAKNLGCTEGDLENIPDHEVYFAQGPVPPAVQAPPIRGGLLDCPQTHKFRMLAQEPHLSTPAGREYLVDSSFFPIQTTITAVVLELEPGALRELHWHPTADEWQYVLSGNVQDTLFGSHGRYRIENLKKGDVGYIPMGYGHSIENLSDTEPARVLIGFNTGKYATVNLSNWLAGNPEYVLSDNFGWNSEVIKKLPRSEVFLAGKGGPIR